MQTAIRPKLITKRNSVKNDQELFKYKIRSYTDVEIRKFFELDKKESVMLRKLKLLL